MRNQDREIMLRSPRSSSFWWRAGRFSFIRSSNTSTTKHQMFQLMYLKIKKDHDNLVLNLSISYCTVFTQFAYQLFYKLALCFLFKKIFNVLFSYSFQCKTLNPFWNPRVVLATIVLINLNQHYYYSRMLNMLNTLYIHKLYHR